MELTPKTEAQVDFMSALTGAPAREALESLVTGASGREAIKAIDAYLASIYPQAIPSASERDARTRFGLPIYKDRDMYVIDPTYQIPWNVGASYSGLIVAYTIASLSGKDDARAEKVVLELLKGNEEIFAQFKQQRNDRNAINSFIWNIAADYIPSGDSDRNQGEHLSQRDTCRRELLKTMTASNDFGPQVAKEQIRKLADAIRNLAEKEHGLKQVNPSLN